VGRGRQGGVNAASTGVAVAFPLKVRTVRRLIQEPTMADAAFVLVTVAVFALVALIARGVGRL
jgi:hypothetical protein